MRYEILGEPLPAVTCFVNEGETLITAKRFHVLDES